MAPSRRPGRKNDDEDSLATVVDRRAPDFLSDDYEEADTTPGRLAPTFGEPPGRFEEAETEAQPLGTPLDGSFPEPWPPPDPFGEAKTIARNREEIAARLAAAQSARAGDEIDEVSPDEATMVGPATNPEAAPPRESTTRPKLAPPQPLAASRALEDASPPDARGGASVEKTLHRPSRAPEEGQRGPKTPAPGSSLQVPRRAPRPSTPHPPGSPRPPVDPEQAFGFMTVGLLVGLAMSALVVSIVAGWLFAVQ